MKLITPILAFLILGTLNAWAEQPNESTINWKSSKEIKALIELKLDPKKGEVTYGPNFAYSDKSLLENYSEIYLTRVVAPDDEETYQLFVTAHYNDQDWRSYNTAIKKDGAKLDLVTLSKNENVTENNVVYKYEEQLLITMTFIDFADAFSGGLNLTISGNQTDKIEIPGSYFQAMLQSM